MTMTKKTSRMVIAAVAVGVVVGIVWHYRGSS